MGRASSGGRRQFVSVNFHLAPAWKIRHLGTVNSPFINRFWCLTLGALLVALLAGCDPAAPSPPMRVGTFPWTGYEPLHVASDLGYFNGGTRVRLVEFSSSTQTLRALRNGSIEAATLTLDETLLLAEDLPDIRVVLAMDISHGADVVLGRPGMVDKLADLRGRRVGYEATALGAYVLSRALETAGLRADEVIPVSVQLDEHEKAYSSGRVDAIVTFDPMRSRVLAAGGREVFNSTQMPGEIVDTLVVRQGYLEKHPEAVETLLRGWFKVLDYRKQSPEDATRRLAERLRLTPEQTRDAYRLLLLPDLAENRRMLGGASPAQRAATERLGAVMLRHKLLRRPPALDALFDARALERLETGR